MRGDLTRTLHQGGLILNLKYLEELLRQHNVPLDKWGQGNAKTTENLLEELNGREAILQPTENGLIRYIRVVAVDVWYSDGRTSYHLEEQEQCFANGRLRTRKLDSSLGEKIKPGEKPLEAVLRALREELALDLSESYCTFEGEKTSEHPSGSYPGIRTSCLKYRFRVCLPKRAYRPEGCRETGDDKETIWVWKPC